MRYTSSALVFIVFGSMAMLISACKKDKAYYVNGCGVEEETYHFFPSSYLELHFYGLDTTFISPEIIKGTGEKLVFQYLRTVDVSTCNCADCGAGDWVLFEVDDTLVSFDFKTEDLALAKLLGGAFSGFAGGFIMYEVNQGEIKGLRINNNEWELDIDVLLAGARPIKVKHRFKLE